MKQTMAAVLILAIALAVAVEVSAEKLAYLSVYPDETLSDCSFENYGGAVAVAYVVLTNAIPLQEITFSVPVPLCLGGAGAYLNEFSSFPTSGNSQTGVTVQLGGCVSSFPVTIMTIVFDGDVPFECCAWEASSVSFVDCDGITRSGDTGAVCYFGPPAPGCQTVDVLTAYDPDPPDGSVNVPTNATLSWLLPDNGGDIGVYLGTSPPPSFWNAGYLLPFDATSLTPSSELLPNTTYYWEVAFYLGDTSPRLYSGVWSFTTGDGPVATEESTWSRIKALYLK